MQRSTKDPLTHLQRTCVNKVKKLLEKDHIKGVCLDTLPTDDEIQAVGMDKVVDRMYLDTLYWEGL